MKYLNGESYVEVKDKRNFIYPNKIIPLRKRDPAKSLRTQYQVQNNVEIRKKTKTCSK